MKKYLFPAFVLFFIGITAKAQKTQKHKLPKAKCTTVLGDVIFKEIDTAGDRGVSDVYRSWDNGSTILVKFMRGGSRMVREKVMLSAKQWEAFANITFKFVPDTTTTKTDLRIKLGKGSGHNSAVGMEAIFRSQSEQTINFDTLFFADADYYIGKLKAKGIDAPYNWPQIEKEMKTDPNHWDNIELTRVVMHEFGHALGLLHEQSFPGAIKWNKSDSVYQYYKDSQGWDRDKVDFNVFEISEQFYTNGTTYDPKSIMHYSVDASETLDGYSVKTNYILSAGDKALIAALYPKYQKESNLLVPKVTIDNFTKLDVINDPVRKGLVIRPSFDLKTNSKLGQVYFAARLVDEEGYYIKTTNQYYNWGGTAAAYRKMNLLPNTKISYNKPVKNFELFFPFDQMPELNGKKIVVAFAVYLDDVANNQMDKLMYFSTTTPLSVTK
jgi:serralysin